MNTHRFSGYEFIAVFLLAFLLVFLKVPERITHGFLWAEDTPIFMKGAYEQSLISFIVPYASYFHLLPRLIAYVQAIFGTPITAPYFYSWSCVFITVFCSAYTFTVAKRYFENIQDPCRRRSRWNDFLALLIALSFILIRQQGEVLLNITNLQWILAPTMLVLLFDLLVLQERSYLLLKIGGLCLMVLTGPFSILFLPLFTAMIFIQWKKKKEPILFLFLSIVMVGALIQGIAVLDQRVAIKMTVPIDWWNKTVEILLAQLFFSTPPYDFLLGKIYIAAIPILILLSVVGCVRWSLVPFFLIAVALELWCASIIHLGLVAETIPLAPCGCGGRYFFIPAIFLAWALIISIKLLPGAMKGMPIALLLMLFSSNLGRFQVKDNDLWKMTKQETCYEVVAPPGWKTTILIDSKKCKN